MKKMYTFILGLFVTSIALAQPLTSQWIKKGDGVDFTWFTAGDNNVTSLAYNPVTDRLLVSRRNDRIFILNPATGAQVGTLNTTGWGTESFKANKIRVTEDGVIYAISLAGTSGSAPYQCKIYRWADQTATPTLCADFTVTERCGDAFGISGTGNNTILYASGAALAAGGGTSINIYVLNTVNGLNFFPESRINFTTSGTISQWANRAIDPVSNSLTSDLWINSGGGPARRITVGAKTGDTRTATVAFTTTDGVGNGQVSNGYGGLKLLTTSNNNKFLIFAGGNNSNAGVRTTMLNVTNEAAVTTYGIDSTGDSFSYVANTNGTGDAAFKNNGDGTYTIFGLSTNNAILATKTDANVLPVSFSSFNAAIRNNAVAVNWTTETESNNKGFEIQKSINGKDFSTIGFVATKAINGISNNTLSYQFEDTKVSEGRSFYRLKQVDKDGKFALSNIQAVEFAFTGTLTIKAIENPVRSNLGLNIKTSERRTVQINVTNALGMLVFTKQYVITAGENNLQLPATQLPKGSLFVTVKDVQKAQETRLQIIKL